MDHMITWTTHLKVRFADVEMQIFFLQFQVTYGKV